ncbi:retrovirus-related pol polyprotein from transposon TNT 1-94 [Tanacetum coccineum]
MRPFGCPVAILNTIDHLGKFDGKADEGFFVGYSLNSKAFRVFHSRTRIVEENLHFRFSENTTNVVGTKASDNADPNSSHDDRSKPSSDNGKKDYKDDEDDGAEADMNNLDTTIQVSPNLTTRIHKDHPLDLFSLSNWKFAISYYNKKDVKEFGGTWKNPKRIHKEGIDYDEVFAPVARIEAIRLFLAYASFKDFVVYQMDVKSAFLYGKIEKEVYCMDYIKLLELGMKLCQYICWTMSFKEGKLTKSYSSKGTKMSSMGELTFFLGLQVQQKKDGIFISQDKYVNEILKKFRFIEVKTASTPIETQKPLLKDEDGEEVDVHMYRSMIGSLMYLTSSRPDIMFVVYFPFDLVAYTDSDYAGAILDRKSTTGGCLFLGSRLISWQCKKQIVVANSTTKAEYVAASSCCG